MLTLNLQSGLARVAMLLVALFVWSSLAGFALLRFVTAVASDPEIPVERATLEAAASYFPDSARVQARLAARLVEADLDETEDYARRVERAVYYAERAARLVPANYEAHLLLAAAREMAGDLGGAEAALNTALTLAPRRIDLRWHRANLLVRKGELEPALAELGAVAAADPERLAPALDLVWQATDGDLDALQRVAGPGGRLALAHLLVTRGQAAAAVDLAAQIDRETLIGARSGGELLDGLVAARQVEQAARLWHHIFGEDGESPLWNGGFEQPIRAGLAQFDWQLGRSEKVRIGVTGGIAHMGRRALRLAYLGEETTRLEGEIRQLVLVRPGARYRLACYARAEGLVTPDGPHLAVSRTEAPAVLAVSQPVEPGTHEWQELVVEFTAPADVHALLVGIRQTPRYSYAEPTRGTVWFDDCSLTQR